MSLWKWVVGLGALGFGGYKVKEHLDAVPRLGDMAIVPLTKVQVSAGGPPAAVLSTPLADGTIFINVLSAPDSTGRISGSVRNVLGVTLPVSIMRGDILRLTRGGTIVP